MLATSLTDRFVGWGTTGRKMTRGEGGFCNPWEIVGNENPRCRLVVSRSLTRVGLFCNFVETLARAIRDGRKSVLIADIFSSQFDLFRNVWQTLSFIISELYVENVRSILKSFSNFRTLFRWYIFYTLWNACRLSKKLSNCYLHKNLPWWWRWYIPHMWMRSEILNRWVQLLIVQNSSNDHYY